jgi:hypothetical protein
VGHSEGATSTNHPTPCFVNDTQTSQHYFVTQYLETHAKDTAAAIRNKCEKPESFSLMPIEDSSL